MKYKLKKTIATILVFLFLISTILPVTSSLEKSYSVQVEQKELHLLRVEHYLLLHAVQNTSSFIVKYAFPPDYQYQTPLLLEIFNDSTAGIIHHSINDDANEPNKVVNFTIGNMIKDEDVLVHFTCWVLVKNHYYDDLPNYVDMPQEFEIPEEAKTWIVSTEVVQAESIIIRFKALQLKGLSNNLIQFAGKIAPFIKEHRHILFLLELYLGLFLSQDAITTLFFSGENVGRAHLACALLRSQMVPSRVLLVNNDQGFWTQMHYMAEYYCPGYGWVLIETTGGKTPYETRRQIVNRVCHPDDEEDTKRDYIFPFMKGEERWIWIENENVNPRYIDCDKGSKSQMFSESVVETDIYTADCVFLLTRSVFHQYQKNLGKNLTIGDYERFEEAVEYQKEAINELKDSNDLNDYIFFLNKAYNKYEEIGT